MNFELPNFRLTMGIECQLSEIRSVWEDVDLLITKMRRFEPAKCEQFAGGCYSVGDVSRSTSMQ